MSDKKTCITVLIENAERLQKDAVTLYNAGAYPSSMALFISSIEQSNEAMRIYYGLDFIKKIGSKHSNRHIIGYFIYFLNIMKASGFSGNQIEKIFDYMNNSNKTSEIKMKIINRISQQIPADKSDILEKCGIKEVCEGFNIASSMDMEKIRQKSIYVDTDSDYNITSLPSEVDREYVNKIMPLCTYGNSLAKLIFSSD